MWRMHTDFGACFCTLEAKCRLLALPIHRNTSIKLAHFSRKKPLAVVGMEMKASITPTFILSDPWWRASFSTKLKVLVATRAS